MTQSRAHQYFQSWIRTCLTQSHEHLPPRYHFSLCVVELMFNCVVPDYIGLSSGLVISAWTEVLAKIGSCRRSAVRVD
jgi:hypothetical protein